MKKIALSFILTTVFFSIFEIQASKTPTSNLVPNIAIGIGLATTVCSSLMAWNHYRIKKACHALNNGQPESEVLKKLPEDYREYTRRPDIRKITLQQSNIVPVILVANSVLLTAVGIWARKK